MKTHAIAVFGLLATMIFASACSSASTEDDDDASPEGADDEETVGTSESAVSAPSCVAITSIFTYPSTSGFESGYRSIYVRNSCANGYFVKVSVIWAGSSACKWVARGTTVNFRTSDDGAVVGLSRC